MKYKVILVQKKGQRVKCCAIVMKHAASLFLRMESLPSINAVHIETGYAVRIKGHAVPMVIERLVCLFLMILGFMC